MVYKMGFIYKITNTVSGKCYIGETAQPNPEKRWKQHIQSAKNNVGCPALRGAIKKYGIDKFKFEILIICFDEDRFIYEKKYIKKYNCQVPNGYNILPGGEGGGFLGKTHTDESIKKIVNSLKEFNKENPKYYETYREKHKEAMKKVDLSSAVKNSEIWKNAVEEGRVGGKAHKDGKPSEETKVKIRESVLKYYKENKDAKQNIIEKHRKAMTDAVGRKVVQCTTDNKFIKEYNSIADAGRHSGVKKSNIQQTLCGNTKTAGGYIWKYVNEKDLKTE